MSENVKVAIRFRPLNHIEKNDNVQLHLEVDTNRNIVHIVQPLPESEKTHREAHEFTFDNVFDWDTGQEQIFNIIARNAIEWVCQGYNSTIFAYGATSSGKSYTMFGHENSDTEHRGIIPRACEALFHNINANDCVIEAKMRCSFLEIYREHIRDLLDSNLDDHNNNLKIRQAGPKGVYVQGLKEKFVYSSQEILDIIKEGARQRTTAATALNNVSSRSHAVLTLILTQMLSDGSEMISKLNLVDLAGSENVGRSEAQGTTLVEAQTINKSLSCLGNVIYALTEKNRDHIPYRDSKLTYLLQDSLGGNSKTIIIATASPSVLCYSETLNTLKFAKRAKEIKNIPKINKNESNAYLLQTIEMLKKQITELENKYEDSRVIIQAVEHAEKDDKENALLRAKCERLEKKICDLDLEIIKEEKRSKKMKDIFEKQRELAKNVAKELYKERLKNCIISNELEQYKMFYSAAKDTVDNPDVLTMMVSRSKIKKSSICIDIGDRVSVDVEIDSPVDVNEL